MTIRTLLVRKVLDVVNNPDLLPLWCEPLHHGMIIITKSSEGAAATWSATTHRLSSPPSSPQQHAQQQERAKLPERQREYDGEWIEATTLGLVSPSMHGGGLSPFDAACTFWNCLGFPSYAKITMFVECLRGQVGLTMGPFPGGFTCSHTITVTPTSSQVGDSSAAGLNGVTVVDRVRITIDEEESTTCTNWSESLLLCGACHVEVKKCFLPTMTGYMDQSASSLSQLRVLLEHGETAGYCILEENLKPYELLLDNNDNNHNSPNSNTVPLLC